MAGAILAAVIAAPAAAGEKTPREGTTLRPQDDLCRILGELRGQRFHDDVPVERLTREQSRDFLRRKLEQEYPPEAIAAEQAAYRAFGLLRADEDLEALFVELMVERAAGFYDPEARRLFIVEGQPWARTVLAHELAHALQDQIFGIDGLLREARHDDDRLRAVQAMIEGEAMWIAGRLASRSDASRLLTELEQGVSAPDAPKSSAVDERAAIPFPAVLQAELSFPYTSGLAWIEAVATSSRGIRVMDEMFRHPPESTEQILHPERSREPRDHPSPPPRKALVDLAADGYRVVKVGTWGEFGMRLVLQSPLEEKAPAAAAGWDGDLFALYEPPGGGTSLVWLSSWDTEADASEFERAAALWLGSRAEKGGGSKLVRSGTRVALVENLPDGIADRALETAWAGWPDAAVAP